MAASVTFCASSCHIGAPCLKATLNISSNKGALRPGLFRSHIIRAVHLQTASPSKDLDSKKELEDATLKVFADETKGIVCYQTESGEIVCEGMDEGPHFYPPSGSNFYMPDTRAAAILPLLGEVMYEI